MPQRKCLCLKGEVSKNYVKSVDMLEEYYVMGRLLLLECFCLSIRVCLSTLEEYYVMGRLLWECCVFV